MNSESTPPNAPEKEVQKTIAYVDNAIKITSSRIHDENLLKEVVDVFDAIRLLCEMHFDKARDLQLVAGELLMGVTAPIDTSDLALLRREMGHTMERLVDIVAKTDAN